MKVIDYSIVKAMTADTTLFTADNATLTADIVVQPEQIDLEVIPRYFVDEVQVTLYNELTFQEDIFTVPAAKVNGYMRFSIFTVTVKEEDSLELTVRDTAGNLLYRDKAYVTRVKDLANYKLNYPDNNGIIIIP